jgi:hypothetical protein
MNYNAYLPCTTVKKIILVLKKIIKMELLAHFRSYTYPGE